MSLDEVDFGVFYNRKGESIDFLAWAHLRSNPKYTQVARTEFDDVLVSTVWLGMDLGTTEGAPVIFETFVFGGPFDHSCYRYRTEEGALDGHEAVVRMVQAGS